MAIRIVVDVRVAAATEDGQAPSIISISEQCTAPVEAVDSAIGQRTIAVHRDPCSMEF